MTKCTMRIHPRELSASLRELDVTERGVLISLLSFMWCREGHTSDDDKANARVCGVTRLKYVKIKELLISYSLIEVIQGRIYPASMAWRFVSRSPMDSADRDRILSDNKYQCSYCGCEDGPFEIDHIFPASKGGTNHPRNLQIACRTCNANKRDKRVWEFQA